MTVAETNSNPPVVCVFCASAPGKNPVHLDSARELGKYLHSSGYNLVYGGGTMGMMGEVAKTLVSLSGPDAVHGIIPRALIKVEKDVSLRNGENTKQHKSSEAPSRPKAERSMSALEMDQHINGEESSNENKSDEKTVPESEFGHTTIVPDMHTRKHLMSQEVEDGGPGSGFIALAGGYGTLEEVMEQVTWNQLGIMSKPVVLVNVNGYWDGLIQWVKNSVQEGFVGEANANILVEVKQLADVVPALTNYQVAKGRFNLDWDREAAAKKKNKNTTNGDTNGST